MSVLERLGFVKLRNFGLFLTPEGRILSIRPAILDDGTGGRIVGWKDDDLAELQLARWAGPAARPAAEAAVAPRVAVAMVPTPVPTAIASAVPTPAAVADAAVVEEDDWEWTIAIARARTAAEDTESYLTATAVPAPALPRRMRADTVPPPVTTTVPPPPRPRPVTQQSKTVIPVPTIPSLSAVGAKLSPVTRQTGPVPTIRQMPTPLPPQQPRRFAKGTMPMTPTTVSLPRPDHAVVTNVAKSAVPALMMPLPALSKTLPSIVSRKA